MNGLSTHLANAGYRVEEAPVADGKLHRLAWAGRNRSDKTGWCVAWDHGDWSAAVWGDWRDGISETWCSREARKMTPAARAIFAAETAAARLTLEQEQAAARLAAQSRAWVLWTRGEPAESHPYLTKKGIPGSGFRVDGDSLLVPLRDANGFLANVQRIGPAGEKRFVRAAAVAGMACILGVLPAGPGDVCICEGAATAATVRLLSGGPVVAAMNAGNLLAVAEWVRLRSPDARIIICADDDRWNKDGTPRPGEKNVGKLKAAAAASAVGGLVVPPVFANVASRGTDWNDLWLEEGENATRGKWLTGLSVAGLDATMATMGEAEYQQRKASLTMAYKQAGAGTIGPKVLDQKRKEATAAKVGAESESAGPAAVLAKLASEPELWHDQFGVALATFELDGKKVNARVDGQLFRDWLRMAYEDSTGSALPPGREMVSGCLEQTAARARSRGRRQESFVRVGWDGEARWLDLGRDGWEAVRIDAKGWTVEENPTVKFTRGEGDVSLPVPVKSTAGMAPLWALLNVGEEDRCLIAGWLLGTMVGNAPSFGLNLHGGQGTAKSTATRILRRLLDPAPGLTQPLNQRRVEELPLTCLDQWIPCFENISWLEDEVQDALCMLTTGLSLRNRKLYSDASMVSYNVRRPWIINGINNVCSRNDLAERAVPVGLLPLAPEARRTEWAVEQDFEAAWPGLLGTLLDAVSQAADPLCQRGAADLLAGEGLSHRMADALVFITAGEESLGFAPGSFIRRLNGLQEEAGREALESHPVLLAIEALLDKAKENPWKYAGDGGWTGKPEEIMQMVIDLSPGNRPPKGCDDARKLGMWLKRETGRIRQAFGIEVGEPKLKWDGAAMARERTIRKIR